VNAGGPPNFYEILVTSATVRAHVTIKLMTGVVVMPMRSHPAAKQVATLDIQQGV